MWIITVAVLLAGGLLGAANLIVAEKPNAKELIDKLTPYQGRIGVVLVVWGVFDVIRIVPNLAALSENPSVEFFGLDTIDRLLHPRIEVLDTKAQAIKTDLAEHAKIVVRQIARIHLDADLCIIGKTERVFDKAQQIGGLLSR